MTSREWQYLAVISLSASFVLVIWNPQSGGLDAGIYYPGSQGPWQYGALYRFFKENLKPNLRRGKRVPRTKAIRGHICTGGSSDATTSFVDGGRGGTLACSLQQLNILSWRKDWFWVAILRPSDPACHCKEHICVSYDSLTASMDVVSVMLLSNVTFVM